ncbi:flavodoxin family protein (plasmid) [Rhodococcus opacus]|uniref:flavodoxin family protein n=2 Tax=Rhodococcus opacus TaxID=37919 RepID=UPI001BB023F2|nr:flavodoxin family protein [Rhodococcus opacus]MDV7090102.1 flavodoxin family protein [Rhodococcus opacus]UNN04548.1 hypothetical protein MOO23_36515 [Rhodococcus opacus]WKN52643.1 flavodoxin family protein [Rhodococcus opacus]
MRQASRESLVYRSPRESPELCLERVFFAWGSLDEPTPSLGTATARISQVRRGTSKRWFTQDWANKLAAGFTSSGFKSGDKLHTLQFFTVLAAQHGMHWVNLGLMPGWKPSTASECDLKRLGIFVGAGTQTDMDEGVEAVHKADIAAAEHLGRRVADAARATVAGRVARLGG